MNCKKGDLAYIYTKGQVGRDGPMCDCHMNKFVVCDKHIIQDGIDMWIVDPRLEPCGHAPFGIWYVADRKLRPVPGDLCSTDEKITEKVSA